MVGDADAFIGASDAIGLVGDGDLGFFRIGAGDVIGLISDGNSEAFVWGLILVS